MASIPDNEFGVRAISAAVCDGMRDCTFVTEVPDRNGCGVLVPYTEILASETDMRVFVRSYTTTPGLIFDPPCGDSWADFYSPNETDATSAAAPHWRKAHSSVFIETDDHCVLQTAPDADDYVAVVHLVDLGYSRDVTFSRSLRDDAPAWFSRTTPRGEWLTESGVVRLTLELDHTYTYPGCCAMPSQFNDSALRLWRQSALESTCDVVDSAEYVYEGSAYTTASRTNVSHERWRFEVAIPASAGYCYPGSLTDPFTVDVYVPSELEESSNSGPPVSSVRRDLLDPPGIGGWVYVVVPILAVVSFVVCVVGLFSTPSKKSAVGRAVAAGEVKKARKVVAKR